MVRKALALGLASVIVAAFAATVMSDETQWGPYQVGEKRSGYTFATAETQAIQDDDFANPAFIWIDDGESLWETAEGTEGKSCASCHGDAAKSMKGVGATYPKYDAEVGKLVNLELRINRERETRMGAKPWKYESLELLAITAFVKNQSRGMPVNVSIDGPAAPFFEKGKEFYYQRRGQLDMACANCHLDYPDTMIRANRLSQGHGNGFPLYRLKWQKLGSLHRRFRGCNSQVRAERYGYGSDEYVNLELFVTWRDQDLPVETPAVRM